MLNLVNISGNEKRKEYKIICGASGGCPEE